MNSSSLPSSLLTLALLVSYALVKVTATNDNPAEIVSSRLVFNQHEHQNDSNDGHRYPRAGYITVGSVNNKATGAAHSLLVERSDQSSATPSIDHVSYYRNMSDLAGYTMDKDGNSRDSSSPGNKEDEISCYKFEDDGSQVTIDDAILDRNIGLYVPKSPGRKFKVDCKTTLYYNKQYHDIGHGEDTPNTGYQRCDTLIIDTNDVEPPVGNDTITPFKNEKFTKQKDQSFEVPSTQNQIPSSGEEILRRKEQQSQAPTIDDNDRVTFSDDDNDRVTFSDNDNEISSWSPIPPTSRGPGHDSEKLEFNIPPKSEDESQPEVSPKRDEHKVIQPSGASSSGGTFSVSRGKGHDQRDPGYWTSTEGNGSLESCKALSNDENLRNPFLYMSNVARCQEGVNTALTWNKTLEEDAKGMVEAAFEYISEDPTVKIEPFQVVDSGKALDKPTEVISVNGNGSWQQVVMSRLGGNLHAPIPHRDENGAFTDVPTGQNLMYGTLPSMSHVVMKSSSIGPDGQYNVTSNDFIATGSSSIAGLLTGDVSLDDVEINLAEVNEYGKSQGIINSNTLREFLGVDGGSGVAATSLKPEDQFPEMRTQIPNNYSSSGNDSALFKNFFYPLSFLRSQYLGGLDDTSDLSKTTISLNEYLAARYYIDSYLRERDTIEKVLSGGVRDILNNPFGRIRVDDDSNYPTGHLVQMLWASTTEVGCGSHQKYGIYMTVCAYYPAGNVNGQIPSDLSNVESNSQYLSISSDRHASSVLKSFTTEPTESTKTFLKKYYSSVGRGN